MVSLLRHQMPFNLATTYNYSPLPIILDLLNKLNGCTFFPVLTWSKATVRYPWRHRTLPS